MTRDQYRVPTLRAERYSGTAWPAEIMRGRRTGTWRTGTSSRDSAEIGPGTPRGFGAEHARVGAAGT